MSMITATCKDCRYCSVSDMAWGLCRVNAPSKDEDGSWPRVVLDHDWCGKLSQTQSGLKFNVYEALT